MSDYWVSHKKYYCKYCEIYIADDAPSRRQHENGLRHKGNRDRYVRSLYKEGERKKKDLEEEKREMARIEKAAGAAYARDLSSGHTSAASSSKLPQPVPPTSSTLKKPERPTSPWTNYTTAQSLGITDPDEEIRLAELERRKTQGLVGEWEVVAPPPPPLLGDELKQEGDTKEGLLSDAVPKNRDADTITNDEDDSRQYKLRKRKLNAGLDEIWDPGDIPIKLKSNKVKHESSNVSADPSLAGASTSGSSDINANVLAGEKERNAGPGDGEGQSKWKPMGWKQATVSGGAPLEADTGGDDLNMKKVASLTVENRPLMDELKGVTVAMVQPPDQSLAPSPDDDSDARMGKIKEEDPPSGACESSSGLFRKRKRPIGSRGGR